MTISLPGTCRKNISVWNLTDLSFQRSFKLNHREVQRGSDPRKTAAYTGNRLDFYDLTTGKLRSSARFEEGDQIAGYNEATNEILVLHNRSELHVYQANEDEKPKFRDILYPDFSDNAPGKMIPELSVRPGNCGSFSLYDKANKKLWACFTGGETEFIYIDNFDRPPHPVWSGDGTALAVKPDRNAKQIRFVTRNGTHQWPVPEWSTGGGVLGLNALTSEIAVFSEIGKLYIRNIATNSLIGLIDVTKVSLPGLPSKSQTRSPSSMTLLSDNGRYLFMNSSFNGRKATTVTDLHSMQTKRLKERVTEEAAESPSIIKSSSYQIPGSVSLREHPLSITWEQIKK